MLKFDENVYLENARLTYETRDEIEKVADEITQQGFKNIFFYFCRWFYIAYVANSGNVKANDRYSCLFRTGRRNYFNWT